MVAVRTLVFGFDGRTHSNSKPPSSLISEGSNSYWCTSYSGVLYLMSLPWVSTTAPGCSCARIEKLTSLSQRIIFTCGLKSGCLLSPISICIRSNGSSLTVRENVLSTMSNLSRSFLDIFGQFGMFTMESVYHTLRLFVANINYTRIGPWCSGVVVRNACGTCHRHSR